MNALQAHEFDDIPEKRERLQIETIDQVNWVFRKLSAIEAKRKELKQLAEAELYRIKSWLESETSKLDRDADYFQSLLNEYAIRQRDIDPQWRKTSTPYGTVKFKRQVPKWHYDDERLIESLKSAGRTDLIRIKEEPNKVELKKAVKVVNGAVVDTESGAVLEGVLVEELPDAVVVEVGV